MRIVLKRSYMYLNIKSNFLVQKKVKYTFSAVLSNISLVNHWILYSACLYYQNHFYPVTSITCHKVAENENTQVQWFSKCTVLLNSITAFKDIQTYNIG